MTEELLAEVDALRALIPFPVEICTHRVRVPVSRGIHCLTCGGVSLREVFSAELETVLRDRYRLPSSPWTNEERAEDNEYA